jgi:hypothetical protein
MSANFSVRFIINEQTQTRVIRLTDTSTGFTLAKGIFSVYFPDGSTRIKSNINNPDITSSGGYIDIPAVTDKNGVIKGAYTITFAALGTDNQEYTFARNEFDFNWSKPSNGLKNQSDVIIPEVKFSDESSYTTIGNFNGVVTKLFQCSFPSTSEASALSPIVSSGTLLDVVYSGKYYEGVYNPTITVDATYTHSSNSWLTVKYDEQFTKQFLVKKCPNQSELLEKINAYRAVIDGYKEKNDERFNLLSEQYDLVIGLYSHIIARYETNTADGSESQLRELLSILEPYSTSYVYQQTKMLPFALSINTSNSLFISDGVVSDTVSLGETISFISGNAALPISLLDNTISFNPIFGTSSSSFAQGNDSRFHNAVTLGTQNGLSLSNQVISLATATTSSAGAMSSEDKSKLDGIAANAQVGTVTSVALTAPTAFSVTGSPITNSGTLVLSAAGTPQQYITGAGGLATLNTSAVPEGTNLYYTTARFDSAFGAKSTTNLAEGTNLYFTNSRARSAISASGNISYNSTTGVISYTTPTETDPIFVASPSYGITSTNITNWNTAYGWGNHALAGYLTAITSLLVTNALGFTPENATNKGVANGYASLDSSGLVPASQLPSYVDDVLEYVNLASFPATGTTGKIYVDLATNKIYRWSGTIYVEVSPTVGTIWGGISGTISNQTDLQNALNSKQNTITLTTTGSSGASTFVSNTLNIPTYTLAGLGGITASFLSAGAGISYSSSTGIIASTITQYTDALARAAISSTATGLSYSSSTGVISLTSGYAIPTSTSITNWNTAYGWGNHASAGYLTSYTETDPTVGSHIKAITATNISNWNSAYSFTNAFPSQTGNSGKYLTTNGTALSWASFTGLLPTGGTAGQILAKIDATNYNTTWIDNYSDAVKHDVKLNSAMSIGTAVYVLTANGTNMIVEKASNATEATSSKTLGLIQTSGILNDIVKVVTEGLLAGLDTSLATIGDPVWLGTNGQLLFGLANKPVAPAHMVYLGVVTRVNANNGEIFVKVQNGYEIDELHNVLITSVANNNGLFYESSTGLWKNKSIASALGYTPYDASNPSGYISSYTETDPTVGSHIKAITTTNISNWNAAYGWGNHTLAGYLTGITSNQVINALGYTPVSSSRTITINGETFDLSADRTWTVSGGGGGGSVTRTVQTFTATANQTTFTITDGYAAGFIDIFVNGVKLTSSDFAATNGTTVVLAQGLLVGDIVDAIVYGNSVVTGTAPIVYNTSTGNISITQSSSSTNGYLSSNDWNTFNNKQSSSNNLISLSSLSYSANSFVKMTASGTFSLDTAQYLTSFTETDPTVGSHIKAITTTNISNWNTAYGWGNHATQGYLTSIVVSNINATGTPSATTYLRGDGAWATISGGASTYNVSVKTSNYTETSTSGTIILKADTSTGGFTITLPSAVGNTSTIIIKKVVSANTLLINTTSSQTIDGNGSLSVTTLNLTITLISDNNNWLII